jgi:Co/Zn/Cd efflux system component
MANAEPDSIARAYHRTIVVIAAAVLAILVVETGAGMVMGSRFLVRDGLEWIYDVLIYVSAAICFGRGATSERRGSFACAAVLVVAGIETLGQVAWTFLDPPAPDAVGIEVSGALIILEALAVAALLVRFRNAENPVILASWLSARNDMLSSTLYALVSVAARFAPSVWPQMAVDLFSAALCFQAAWAIVRAAMQDRRIASREAA